MSDLHRQKILSTVDAEMLIGRTQELDALRRHAEGGGNSAGLLFSSAPAAGASEILRQTFDRIFHEQIDFSPFYFAVKKSDKTARQCAARFVQTFIQQTVASHRRDPKLLDFAGDLSEFAEIAVPSDGHWIDRLIENCRRENSLNDEQSFLRTALSAPLRAAAYGVKTFVMIDDLHETENLTGDADFIEELKETFRRCSAPFVFAGRRRFLPGKFQNSFEILQLQDLSRADNGLLVESLAEKFAVKINAQTRDLIAAQFADKPLFVEFIFQSAAARKRNLDNFQTVEKNYIDELLAGKIGRFYDAMLAEITPNVETQKHLLGLLYDSLTIETEKTPVESWKFRSGLNDTDFYRAVNRLNTSEIVNLSSNLVEAMPENQVLSDYLKSRFRLEMLAEPRALVVAETLSASIKRAPKMMARLYRRNSAGGLREILSAFDSQEIPAALIDYSRFKDEFRGAPDQEILTELGKENVEKIELPQIVYTANTVSFYAPIEQITEKERSVVAFGFEKRAYTDEDETVWIAAEIDSKLEADKDLTEFWCDRLEVAALMCDFRNFKIWLVAPVGFSPESVEVLRRRNGYGSSRKQLNLLTKTLNVETVSGGEFKPNEYEMIVPMGEDTELIAAQTIEEIARRHHFAPKAINQIKTALVEACINAVEHSHSPDRRIYQKFSVEDDRIIVTVANRGLRLSDKKAHEITPDEGRRGWGLKLMKNLMDEVKFEQTDDGTRISMTKFLKNS